MNRPPCPTQHPPGSFLPPTSLRAGPLRLLYEPATGFIRRIQLGEREVIRGIYAAVRDHQWNTVPGLWVETRRVISRDAFHIEFDARHQRGPIDFVWHGILTGEASGVLRYSFDGEARSTFLRNRIGFCLLHPIHEGAGAAARQRRTDGTCVECRFPELIEPQIFGQSTFQDLQAVSHQVEPGVWAEVSFEGETFEMEDQRNWTDASFKTYGTPLAQPFPVEISAGTLIHQSVTLRLKGWEATRSSRVITPGAATAAPIRVTPFNTTAGPMPRLGLGLASHGLPLTKPQIRRLKALRLSHLRVDLHLASTDWLALWQHATRQADQLNVDLELALHLPRDPVHLESAVHHALAPPPVRVARVLALREGEPATTPATLAAVRRWVVGWAVPVGAGSDANFCELNREQALGRCVPAEADFVFWSVNPQVHAFDDTSVMETLEAYPATVESARAFAQGQPLVVTPITLRQRFNPVATGPDTPPLPGELPPQVDPRQAGLLGAAWTFGCLARLAQARVQAITFYETTGWRGVMELDDGPPDPLQFPSIPGAVFPLYHVFAEVGRFAGSEMVPVASSAPRELAGMILRQEAHRALLLANLSPAPVAVDLEAFHDLQSVRQLTSETATEAARDPTGFHATANPRPPGHLPMPPYSIAAVQ